MRAPTGRISLLLYNLLIMIATGTHSVSFAKDRRTPLRYLNEILQVCSDMYEAYFRH